MYRELLVEGGRVHLKTDNRNLYDFTLELCRFNGLEIIRNTDDLYGEKHQDDATAIQTYYENRFRAEGMKINYLQFRLSAGTSIKDLPYDVE